MEAVAFFARDTKDKYTTFTLVEGMRITGLELDIDTEKILSHTPATVKVTLSDAVSKEIMISVFDSDKNPLYMDTVTTNDFGIGKIEFTAPNYYLEDEPVEIIAVFADDPLAGGKIGGAIGFTKVGLAFTSDKTAYAAGEQIMITITTDPPVSTDIHIRGFNLNCMRNPSGGLMTPLTVQTNANGVATFNGEITASVCYNNLVSGKQSWNGEKIKGLSFSVNSDIFEFDRLEIKAK